MPSSSEWRAERRTKLGPLGSASSIRPASSSLARASSSLPWVRNAPAWAVRTAMVQDAWIGTVDAAIAFSAAWK